MTEDDDEILDENLVESEGADEEEDFGEFGPSEEEEETY